MNIDHEFTVPATAEHAWELLTDLEQVATCMPGAKLTGSEGDTHQGLVKVKVGPVTAQYQGTATFVTKDDAGHHAVVAAKGRESRGSGTAAATIDLRLRPGDEGHTVVSVSTDLKISGKIAQFGSGMIQEVSAKLLGQFVQCLESRIAAEPDAGDDAEPAEPEPAEPAGPATGEGAAAGAGDTASPAPEPTPDPVTRPAVVQAARESRAPAPAAEPAEPAAADPALNLVGVVGPALLKRLAPVVAGVVVLVLLVRWLRG
jgi:carbon monoxide dehydrogenase subunit G